MGIPELLTNHATISRDGRVAAHHPRATACEGWSGRSVQDVLYLVRGCCHQKPRHKGVLRVCRPFGSTLALASDVVEVDLLFLRWHPPTAASNGRTAGHVGSGYPEHHGRVRWLERRHLESREGGGTGCAVQVPPPLGRVHEARWGWRRGSPHDRVYEARCETRRAERAGELLRSGVRPVAREGSGDPVCCPEPQ